MNDDAAALDQTDKDILTSTVSDEALEAAAGTEEGNRFFNPTPLYSPTQKFRFVSCC